MKSYEELRAEKPRRFTPEVAAARVKARALRNSAAQSRALVVLSHAFPEEYAAYYKAAKEEISEERGPLPGDEA